VAVPDALAATRDDSGIGPLCATVRRAGLGACPSRDAGIPPGVEQTHGEQLFAGDGLGLGVRFTNYHRVLNHAMWSALQAGQILLGLLIRVLVPPGAILVFGADDTVERRRGRQVKHGKRTSSAVDTKELRQVGNRPPGPLALDFHGAFARVLP
jgi:hypothetical protein